MAKKKSKKVAPKTSPKIEKTQYAVRVVYGFLDKLEVVLLGEVKSGTIEDNMLIQINMESGSEIGKWEILKVLHTDFINQYDNPNFKGLLVKCKNLQDYQLLKMLRIYDEVISVIPR